MQIVLLPLDEEAKHSPIRELLSACALPTADIASLAAAKFFGMEEQDGLSAVVGLEIFEGAALLRSLAVRANRRGHGIGRSLVSAAEQQARGLGVSELYLLTLSAKDFFAELGYGIVDRASAPTSIKGTRQFSGLCPDSAVLMHKRLL